MSKAQNLPATRWQRGLVRTSVTCLERCLNKLEAKDNLSSTDLLAVEWLFKKVEALDIEFKPQQYAVIDLVGDDEHVLDEEQAVMEEHEDKVAEIIEHLQELPPEAKAALLVAHSTDPLYHLHRQLNDMESDLRLIQEEVDTLKPGPGLDSCLLMHLEEQVGSMRKETYWTWFVIFFPCIVKTKIYCMRRTDFASPYSSWVYKSSACYRIDQVTLQRLRVRVVWSSQKLMFPCSTGTSYIGTRFGSD